MLLPNAVPVTAISDGDLELAIQQAKSGMEEAGWTTTPSSDDWEEWLNKLQGEKARRASKSPPPPSGKKSGSGSKGRSAGRAPASDPAAPPEEKKPLMTPGQARVAAIGGSIAAVLGISWLISKIGK